MSQSIGRSFQDSEVVDLYLHRPPYPQELYDVLMDLAPSRGNLLDLGCGPGKIARLLSPYFDSVTAIDPSIRMIELGRSLEHGRATNIHWVEGYVEEIDFSVLFDIVVAANSIHWINHSKFFPKIAKTLKSPHLFAVVEGDEPYEPPWQSEWEAFLRKWVPKLTGKSFAGNEFKSSRTQYINYLEILEQFKLVSEPFQQSIADFILCQHSRVSFAISRLDDQRARFDDELAEILVHHADDNQYLTFRISTKLVAAKIA